MFALLLIKSGIANLLQSPPCPINRQPPRPLRRRWFRFSLRTLFIAVTILCCGLGWKVNAARKQHDAVAAIRQVQSSAELLYDFEYHPFDEFKS